MDIEKRSLYSEYQTHKALSSLFWAWVKSEHIVPAELRKKTAGARSPGLGSTCYCKALGRN